MAWTVNTQFLKLSRFNGEGSDPLTSLFSCFYLIVFNHEQQFASLSSSFCSMLNQMLYMCYMVSK